MNQTALITNQVFQNLKNFSGKRCLTARLFFPKTTFLFEIFFSWSFNFVQQLGFLNNFRIIYLFIINLDFQILFETLHCIRDVSGEKDGFAAWNQIHPWQSGLSLWFYWVMMVMTDLSTQPYFGPPANSSNASLITCHPDPESEVSIIKV